MSFLWFAVTESYSCVNYGAIYCCYRMCTVGISGTSVFGSEALPVCHSLHLLASFKITSSDRLSHVLFDELYVQKYVVK